MPRVSFTRHLERFFPGLTETNVAGRSVRDVLDDLESLYPGLRDYIVDETGALRKHVNIFVDGEVVRDRRGLSDAVEESGSVHILQALSGG